MTATVVVRANEQADPALILFGRDDAGKPRASWFDALSADLARKAADLMKMRVLPVETEEQKAVARQLQPGRVFSSGRAFTPFARREVFSKLVEFEGAHASNGSSKCEAAGNDNGHDASAQPSGGASMSSAANAPKSPEDWDQIGVGSVVLAEDDPDGWWESIVIGENGDAVTLKWRDWPNYPTFVRRRTELALLPPAQQH
jgi:hypothetical protein